MKELTFTPRITEKLRRLKQVPAVLYAAGKGVETLLESPVVAIVGTRKPTPYGIQVTKQLTSELAKAGVVIVSGLALGIDALAHKTCLEAGGKTLAVLPSGLENIYPASNRPLAKDILANGGGLLSEYETKHHPRKVEFLERNRIIAALSDAVVIPEAAGNSGSLNTANHARSMRIAVLAVPGPITSPMSQGTNYLLTQYAKAAVTADDVLRTLGLNRAQTQTSLNLTGETPAETLLLQKIAAGLHTPDELQAATKLTITELQTAATMLELQGKIMQDSLGNWRLR